MIEKVKEAVRTYPISNVRTKNNCGRINKSLCLAINQDTNVDANFVQGEVRNGETAEPHYFISIPEGEIDSHQYIIDGAIEQFVGENDLFLPESLDKVSTVKNKIVIDKESNTPFCYTIIKREN